jgi:hypothetical protein
MPQFPAHQNKNDATSEAKPEAKSGASSNRLETDGASVAEKLSSEASLLFDAARNAPSEFVKRAKAATGDKLGETSLEVAASLAIGTAFALALKKPQFLGRALAPYVEVAASNAGRVLGVAAVYDVSKKVAVPAYEVWKDPGSLEHNKKVLSHSLGNLAFDYSVMGAAGMAGFGIGSRMARLGRTESLTFEGFASQLKASKASEQNIIASVKEENFLGRGSNGAVYKLDFTDKFVVKVAEYGKRHPQPGKLEAEVDFLPGHNVGQPIAKMGDYQILKKQDGFAAGAPGGRTRREMGAEAAEAIYARSVKTSAELPQQAYDDFARTLVALEKNGLQFDPSKPGNILLDPVGKRFNIVDVSKTNSTSPYKHSVADMIVPLVDNYFVGSVLPNKGAIYQRFLQQIITKSNAAAQSAGLPLTEMGSSLAYSHKLAGF